MNSAWDAFHAGTPGNQEMREGAIRNMTKCLAKKPEMLEWLLPKWDFGCRRPSPGLGWLEAISSDNCDVVRDAYVLPIVYSDSTDTIIRLVASPQSRPRGSRHQMDKSEQSTLSCAPPASTYHGALASRKLA